MNTLFLCLEETVKLFSSAKARASMVKTVLTQEQKVLPTTALICQMQEHLVTRNKLRKRTEYTMSECHLLATQQK